MPSWGRVWREARDLKETTKPREGGDLESFADSISMQVVVENLPGSTALATFCGQDGPQREFTGELRSILVVIATTGKYWHDWSQLKSLLCFRLTQVMQEYRESNMHVEDSTPELVHGERFPDLLDRLLQGLESFTQGAPFTSQRLCELLLNPKDTYVNLDKLSLAFEKLLLVTSTEPASNDPYPSIVQPSTKHVEPVQKVLVADPVLPEVFTINGSHEENGRHKEIPDEEMVDVEGVADRPLEVEATRPLEVEASRPLEVEATRPLEVEATQLLEVEATQPLEVEATQQLEVEATQPVEVEATRPTASEGFAVPKDASQKMVLEETSNGHIGTSGSVMVEDISLGESIAE